MTEKKKSVFSELNSKPNQGERRFSTLNASRWSFGFQMLRSHIGKIIILNLILLVSAIPAILLIFNRSGVILEQTQINPFSANMGIGYLPFTRLVGLEAGVTFEANKFLLKFMPFAVLPFGATLAGSLYVLRNLFWLEDVRVFKDFWKGLTKNWIVIIYTFIFTCIICMCLYCISVVEFNAAMLGAAWYTKLTKVVCIIAIILFTMMFLNGVTMAVTYRVKFFGLIKNSFLISVILSPLHVFFAAIAIIPFLLIFLGGMFMGIGVAFIVFMGFSYALLVWTDYSHWIYDKFMPTPKPAKDSFKVPEKPKAEVNTETETVEVNDFSLVFKPFDKNDYLVESIPMVFSLSDIDRLNADKEFMRKDSDKFEQEHQASEEKARTATAETNDAKEPQTTPTEK